MYHGPKDDSGTHPEDDPLEIVLLYKIHWEVPDHISRRHYTLCMCLFYCEIAVNSGN